MKKKETDREREKVNNNKTHTGKKAHRGNGNSGDR